MTKEQIAALITAPDSTLYYLSAQDYGRFTREDRELLREVVIEAGVSFADYQEVMVSLFPKQVTLKAGSWRKE